MVIVKGSEDLGECNDQKTKELVEPIEDEINLLINQYKDTYEDEDASEIDKLIKCENNVENKTEQYRYCTVYTSYCDKGYAVLIVPLLTPEIAEKIKLISNVAEVTNEPILSKNNIESKTNSSIKYIYFIINISLFNSFTLSHF